MYILSQNENSQSNIGIKANKITITNTTNMINKFINSNSIALDYYNKIQGTKCTWLDNIKL